MYFDEVSGSRLLHVYSIALAPPAPTARLGFPERLALHTPDLLSLSAAYSWTDEDSDDGDEEPLTHYKTDNSGPQVAGQASSLWF